MTRAAALLATALLLTAGCAPASTAGGIRVDGPTDHASLLGVDEAERACRGVELFPAGWSTPGNPWIRRCG